MTEPRIVYLTAPDDTPTEPITPFSEAILPLTPLWVTGTPAADEHVRRLQEIGLLTPDVDGDDDDGL